MNDKEINSQEEIVEEEQVTSKETCEKDKNNQISTDDESQVDSEPTSEEGTSQIEELEQKVSELEDKNLRLQAEIVNMRQRNQKDRELSAKYRSQDLAKEILPVIDNLERALEVECNDDNSEALKKGVEMVLDNLRHTLKNHGIEVIVAEGEVFDPNVHQAVQTVPSDENNPTDTVVKELQKGYKLHDRVLRPSMVIVAQ